MKWSPILHNIAAIAGIAGALSLVGAWIAGTNGLFLSMSQAHLFQDANGLLLTSIAFGVGSLIHMQQEKK